MNFITEEFNYNIISNGGWQTIPLSMKDKIGYDVDNDYMKLENVKIKTDSLFKILHKKKNDILFVYVRGSKFQMQYFLDLADLLDLLNKNEIIDINLYLKSEKIVIPKEAILYFLALIYDKRGFEIIK